MIGIKKRFFWAGGNLYIIRTLSLCHFKKKTHRNFYSPTNLSIFQCVGTPDDTKNYPDDIRLLSACCEACYGLP